MRICLAVFDGGISSAAFSGVSSFVASEATDQMFGKTEVESSDVAFQLDMTPIEAVGKALDAFLKATDSL